MFLQHGQLLACGAHGQLMPTFPPLGSPCRTSQTSMRPPTRRYWLQAGLLLICLILSAGEGSDAMEARSALVSNLLLWCSLLLALQQVSWEEVVSSTAKFTGTQPCYQEQTLVGKASRTLPNHEWIACGVFFSIFFFCSWNFHVHSFW